MSYMHWSRANALTEIRTAGPSRLKSIANWYGLRYGQYMGKRAGLPRAILDTERLREALLDGLHT